MNTQARPISAMQYSFCTEYIKNGGNAKQAAITAGYSESYALCKTHVILDLPQVKERINKVFTKVLEKGGYPVVTEAGPDVMIVRPALINMRITAPDLPTAGMQTTVVRSAGSVTLYAELYDSATNAKFAEVIDAEEVGGQFAQVANRVTNQAALDRTLDRSPTLLRKRLDEAHRKSK